VRAVEPLEGADAMRAARLAAEVARIARAGGRPAGALADRVARATERLARIADAQLATGPGLVGAAFGLQRSLSGRDLLDPAGDVRLERPPAHESPPVVIAARRVGIAYAGPPWSEAPWRLLIAGSPALSGPPVRS